MFWLSGHALGHYSIWNILVSGGKTRETVRNWEQGVGWWKCLNFSSNFIWRFIKGNGEKENWLRQCSFSKTSLCEGENLKSLWRTAGICREICILKILSYIFITTHFPISFLIEARHPFDEWTQFSAVEQVLKVGAALSLSKPLWSFYSTTQADCSLTLSFYGKEMAPLPPVQYPLQVLLEH